MPTFASFDGTTLAYHDDGDGQPVILLHGFAADTNLNYVRSGVFDLLLDEGTHHPALRHASRTRSELGTRFDRVLALYTNAVLSLRARLAWAHDWVSDPTLGAVFQALPGASFIVNGATPAKNSALASAGTELRLANGVTLIGKFDGEFASRSSTYAGTGTVRYTW